MRDEIYWVWLSAALKAGRRIKPLLEHFGTVENLYYSTFPERAQCRFLTDKMFEELDNTTLEDAQAVIDLCNENGWDIITYDDERYPNKLKEINNPPFVLYVDGKFPDFNNKLSIGVVGTRKASEYAMRVSKLLSKGLAECNTIIVSGGALGVDSAAHQGAIDCGGITVCVLGCGLGTKYLMSNEELRNEIKKNGCLISEFVPFAPANKTTFPMRNRIISGLSDGVLVTEASAKSGSIITAEYAISQRRLLFAIPSSILDDKFAGTNMLIDNGAFVATSPKRILSFFENKYMDTADSDKARSLSDLQDKRTSANAPYEEQITFDRVTESRNKRIKLEGKAFQLTGDRRRIYVSLSNDFETIEEICEKNSSLSINQILVELTMLEMDGLVESTTGKRYRRI